MTRAPRERGAARAPVPVLPEPLRVLYESDDYLAVDKPEGVLSVSQPGGEAGLPDLLRDRFPRRLFSVHRLDRGASGVIVLARTAAAHRHLNGEFDRREVRKTYLALVDGAPASNRGRINAPLREFGSGRMGVDPRRGKPSTTEWKVAERFDGATLLRVSPETGRRHQVRAHLYHLGHPILGDLGYGDRDRQSRHPRLMLHALAIEFRLPSGETVAVEAPPPPSFEAVLAAFRAGKKGPKEKESGQRSARRESP
ncbi:MAG TPA: RluA family pseudouridine synthase [Candidatus Aminicenantes bacterium]|nr:RluA family pseudouridine synthase [Candidatus Aminicenantes bacterium]